VEPGISYDTVFEVALSTRLIQYHILERACDGADPLRGHLNSGCLDGWRCGVFHRCATKGNPWIYCYIKEYFAFGAIYLQ